MSARDALVRRYACPTPTAEALVTFAKREHVRLSLVVAVCYGESRFQNVWGHDPGKFRESGSVTGAGIRRYYAAAPSLRPNGIGPMQLTNPTLQARAQSLGGLEVPAINVRVGVEFLASLVRVYGEQQGLRHYNGSGPAAERYALDRLAAAQTWHDRLT